jgi:hypothetical protein
VNIDEKCIGGPMTKDLMGLSGTLLSHGTNGDVISFGATTVCPSSHSGHKLD